LVDFIRDIHRAFVVYQAQFVNFGFEFGYGLFEVEKYFFSHGACFLSTGGWALKSRLANPVQIEVGGF
jgi:hypothetical protein